MNEYAYFILGILLGIGIAITIILLLTFGDSGTLILILSSLPMLIGLVLVMPIPNYHNTLCAIQSILEFYNGRRNFIWKGWCAKDEYQENK